MSQPTAASPASNSSGLHPDLVAAITAAAMAALGPDIRITQIRLMPQFGATVWSEVGRTNLHHSHTFRKKTQ